MRPTHAEFIEYFEEHAKAAQAETRLKELREKILPYLEAGHDSPADLPYRVKIRIQNRTHYDWKGALRKILKGILRSDRKVEERLTTIEGEFESKEVQALVVVINEQYAAVINEQYAAS